MKARRFLVAVACVALSATTIVPFYAAAGDDDGRGKVSGSADVTNDDPTNLVIQVLGDVDPSTPGSQIAPDPSGTTTIVIKGHADDGNGWRDLKRGDFVVLGPTGAEISVGEGKADGEGNGRKQTWTYTFTMDSKSSPGEYTVRLTTKDKQDASRSAESKFRIEEYLALSLGTSQVSFGSGLAPGRSTHDAPASVAINNIGNIPLDIVVSTGGLRQVGGEALIGPDRIRYAPTPSMDPESPLSVGGYRDNAFDLAPGAAKMAYLDIHVPTGDEQHVPPGRYVGDLTFGGAAG